MLVFFISSNVVNVLLIKCLYAGLFFIVFQMARNASHKPGVYICTNIDKSLGERLGKGQSSRQKLKSSCASVSVHVFGVPPCSSCACLYEWEWGPTFNVEVSMRRRCRRSLRWGSAALRRNDCLNSDWPLDSDPRPRGQTPPCSHARNRSPSEAPSLPPSEQSEGKQRPAHLMLSWTLCFTSVTGLEAKRPGSALSYISDQPLEDSSTPRHIYDIV